MHRGKGLDAGVARSTIDPQLPLSCLTVLIQHCSSDAFRDPPHPLHALVLEVLVEVAENPLTRQPILDVLRAASVIPLQLRWVTQVLVQQEVGCLLCSALSACLREVTRLYTLHVEGVTWSLSQAFNNLIRLLS